MIEEINISAFTVKLLKTKEQLELVIVMPKKPLFPRLDSMDSPNSSGDDHV